MADTIGRSIIEVGADATNLQAGMAQATQAVERFEKAAEDSAQGVGQAMQQAGKSTEAVGTKLDATSKRFLASLEREAAQAGRSRAEYLELRAAQLGLTQQSQAYINRLREQEAAQKAAAAAAAADAAAKRAAAAATREAGIQFNEYGLSAKQTTAALRQVPAQLTDIIVSLQGGQAPLTVLLQQGGQLRDIFGGIVPAARALGGAVVGLINPFTAVAAVAAVLGAAYFQGSKEADRYARALILTGNAAGGTVGSLEASARAVDQVVGTQARASEVIAALGESGLVAARNFEQFAAVAIRIERVTGKAAEETVKQFAELGKEPVEAARRLNSEYNFLTLSVFQQIKALEDQGRVQEAAEVAQRAFAAAFEERSSRLEQRLGIIERSWMAVKDAAKEAWDSILNVGRPDTPENLIQSLEQARVRLQSFSGNNPRAQLQLREIEQQLAGQREVANLASRAAASEAERARINKAAIEAEKEISRIREQSRSNTEKLNAALSAYRRNVEALRAGGGQVSAEQIARDEAAIREQFRERGRQPRAFQDDAATRLLSELRQQKASLDEQLQQGEKLGTQARALVEFNRQIADLKEKGQLTADQKSILANEEKIRQQLQQNVLAEKAVQAAEKEAEAKRKSAQELEQFNNRAAQIQDSIESRNQTRRDQFSDRLNSFGQSSRSAERQRELFRLQRQFQADEDRLRRGATPEILNSDAFQQELEKIRAGLATATADFNKYYSDLEQAEGDWRNGFVASSNEFLDQINNTAARTGQAFTTVFNDLSDRLTDFLTTGKFDFEEFGNLVVREVNRIIVELYILKPLLESIRGSVLGGSGGTGNILGTVVSSLVGGAFSGSFGAATASALPGNSLDNFLSLNNNFVGRDVGGMVSAGGMYRVNENGPELLNLAGRQYLMMGDQSGTINPNPGGGGKTQNININVQVPQGANRQTGLQFGRQIAQQINIANTRNG